jgi:HK97 family phage portal protein
MASFLQRLRNGLKAFNSQQTNESYNRFIYDVLGTNAISNNQYNQDYIDKGYKFNPTIYSLVQLISKAAITVPYKVYQKLDESAVKEYKGLLSDGLNEESVFRSKLMRKHIFEEVQHSALGKLLERPNPAQSFSVFLQEFISFGKLTGNRYVYGISPDNGENAGIYTQLYNLPAHLIEIKSEGIFKPVSKYTMVYNKSQYDLKAEEVLHIADFNPDYQGDGSHLYGQSPIEAGMRVLTTANEAVETNLKFLHNQSARGMLSPEDETITPTQAQQLKDALRRNYQGSKSANDIMITGKKFSWTNFGLSTSDLQLLESYNATIKDLCNLYGVPVQLLNNTESTTYDNYRIARKVLFTNAIIPELNKIRDEFNRWLVPQFGDNLYFDFDYSAIPELMPEQKQLVDNLSKSYWLTSNEKREAAGYGVDEDNDIMNEYLVPAQFMPISDLDVAVSEEARFPELPERNIEDEDNDIVEEEVIEDIREEEEEKQEMNAKLRKSLQKKADEHNEKVGDAKSKRTNVRTLFAVYKRGIGAYRTNPASVRPTVTSEQQWAMARVNSFLYALKNGRFRSGKHDQDLLPEGHAMSTKKSLKAISDEIYDSRVEAQERAEAIGCSTTHTHETEDGLVYMPCRNMDELEDALSKYQHEEEERKQELYDDYPKSASEKAKRAKEINESFNNPCATLVGKTRSSDLIARRGLSLAIVKKTFSYLSRAFEYVTGDYVDEKDKPICGDISFSLWGGDNKVSRVEDDPMYKWCKRILDKEEEKKDAITEA